MASRSQPSVRSAVLSYLDQHQPEIVGRNELSEICRHVLTTVDRSKPPSDSYLLSVLLDTEVEVDRAIGGLPLDLRKHIVVNDLEACRDALVALAREYSEASDLVRAHDVRRAVLRTKEHLGLALARGAGSEKLAVQREAFEWLRVWLENPVVFEAWSALRLGTAGQSNQADGPEQSDG